MDIHYEQAPAGISTIDQVVDSKGDPVPPDTTTEDTVLTLTGSGTASSIVFIFDNDVLLTPASVTINRTWNFTETLALGRHGFTVRDSLGGVDSPEWVVTVGEAELELDKPAVAEAPAGILNPMNAINGATVVVTYAMQTTDTIGISWNGLDNLVPTQPGSTLGSVTFTIPASAVAPVIGKTIEVRYGVVRNGVSKPSQPLPLTVQALPDAELEAPRILQATDDGSLDVSALTGDADLKVKPWPFIDAGQLISLRFEGTKSDGSPYNWSHPTWQNLPISSTGEPSTTVALSHLKELKDGSNLTLVFDVSFDGGATSVSFSSKSYVINSYIRTENFDQIPVHLFQAGTVLETPAMTLKFVSGPGNMKISLFSDHPNQHWPVPGQMEMNALALCYGSGAPTQTLEIKPKAPCSRIVFYYIWVDSDVKVKFYGFSGEVILERTLSWSGTSVSAFDVSAGERIERMEIIAKGDWSYYDFFTFHA